MSRGKFRRAVEELVADAMFDAIADENSVYNHALLQEVGKHKGIIEKIMDYMQNVLDVIHDMMRRIRGKNPEAMAMLKHEESFAKQVIDEYGKLLKVAGEKERKGESGEQVGETDEKYSFKKTINEPYEEQFKRLAANKWISSDSVVFLRNTPEVYKLAGMEDLPMIMDHKAFNKITRTTSNSRSGHGLPISTFEHLNEGIKNPLFIIDEPSRNSVMVFTGETYMGEPIAEIFEKGHVSDNERSNRLTSRYTMNDIVSFIDEHKDKIALIDNTKKDAPKIIRTTDLIPVAVSLRKRIDSITQEKKKGNGSEKFSLQDSEGNELTKEQQNFFKDSKVRDEDGNLLVVYHGSDQDFNVWDMTKGRTNMDIRKNCVS